MAIPDTPYTRLEMYLDAIARNGSGGSTGGGVLVVHFDDDTGAADKTWQEIYDAIADGKIAIISYADSNGATTTYIGGALHSGSDYNVMDFNISTIIATATSADGYPVGNG